MLSLAFSAALGMNAFTPMQSFERAPTSRVIPTTNEKNTLERRKPTYIVIGVTAALLIAYDIYAYQTDKRTISQVTLHGSRRLIVIPFLAGVLAGHLFWPQ